MCQICKEEFHGQFAKRLFMRHMKKHNKANNEKERTCPYCGIVFIWKSYLTKHKRSRCYQTQGRDKVHSLSKSKALGATRNDNVENKIKLDKSKVKNLIKVLEVVACYYWFNSINNKTTYS